MTRLKALLLKGCGNLENMPYLGKLKALRELNLIITAIKEAPQGLEELLNLRFLSMYPSGLKMLPRGALLKLGHLQHLNLPRHIQIEEIKNLKQLEEFGGGVKNVSDFNWFITTQVHDSCYRVQVNSNIFYPSKLAMGGDLGCDINELVLCEYDLKDEKVLGKGIVYLTIMRCEGMSKCFADDLARRFDNLTSLKKVLIEYCGRMEWIMRSDGHQISNTLQEVHLWCSDDLKGMVMSTGETGAFASAIYSFLKRLIIGHCNKMRKVGLPISGLPNLEWISIKFCEEIEEIFEEDEGKDPLTTLPKLKLLTLHGLPRLKSVSKATIICNSIVEICIKKCPRLINKLPVHMDVPLPRLLKEIKV